MIEFSICDICNMTIAIFINFLFLFSFFFLLTVEMFCVISFFKKNISKMKEK